MVALGGRLNTGTTCCAQAALRMDATGNPTVAWVEAGGTSRLFVAAWNGSAWSSLGSALDTGSITLANSSLALDAGGNPVVAWVDGDRLRQPLGRLCVGGPRRPVRVAGAQMSVVSSSPLVVGTFSQSSRAG